MRTFFNDSDPKAAEWLRELIRAGELPAGDVDEKDIREVTGEDLRGYSECHFFAGIGGWPYALRLAGWTGPVWTGSRPCQPFSQAGKRDGDRDPRHLWPELRRLVAECRPPVVFGEQVASADGRRWLAGVRGDLEALGYRVGAADLCAAGVGAPHIRQRLYWVADTERRADEHDAGSVPRTQGAGSGRGGDGPGGCGPARRLAVADGRQPRDGGLQPGGEHGQQPEDGGVGRVGDAERSGREGRTGRVNVSIDSPGERGPCGMGHLHGERRKAVGPVEAGASAAGSRGGPRLGPWDDSALIPCRDGKARRTQPGIFPLAHGIPGRVGLIRGYGNAIVPEVAAAFVRAYRDTLAAGV